MRWKESILITLISFGVGFIVGRQPTFASVQNFIIGGISLGLVVEVVGLLRELFKERREERTKKRDKLEEYVHIHNQEMIDQIIKYWFHENGTINEERQRTIEHLQTGYPDIWKLECEREGHKNYFLESEKAIRGKIKDKLEQHTPPSFEWDGIDMVSLLYKSIEGFSIKGGTDEDYRIHLHNFGIFGIRKLVDKNDKNLTEKQENFRKLVDDIVDDKTIIEQFKFISKEKTLFDEKINKFKQCVEGIKHDFEKRHIELKGACKDCKDWHDELKSLT